MTLFSDNIEDDFDDFDDLQQELSKPKQNPLPPLNSNQSKGVLPLVPKQPKREESKNQSQFPSIAKPQNKETFPSLNKKPSNTKFPVANNNKNAEQNDLQDDSYEFDDFENDEFQNTTNKFAANLDQKTKQFQQMNKNIKSLETSIHKKPDVKKQSKQSSRAGTGMIGDDDDEFQEFGESGNNFGGQKKKTQVQKPNFDSKPKFNIKPKTNKSKEFLNNFQNKKVTKKEDDDYDDDQFNDFDIPKLPQQKREKPPPPPPAKKFTKPKQTKKPIFLNNDLDEKPKNTLAKGSNSRSNKELKKHQVSAPNLFQKKKMPNQKTESASILLPIHRKENSKKAKKDLKAVRQNKFERNLQLSPPSSTVAYPTKVNKSNINQHVEHTIQIARDKLKKMEADQQELLNSQQGEDEEKVFNYYEKENRSLRQELKGLNGNLNKLIQAFDANTYMAKQKREARSFSQRPSSKQRLQIQEDEARNNQKIMTNVQREHAKLTKRLEEVQGVEYTINLQKKIQEEAVYINEYKLQMKKMVHSQRELEKKMDGFMNKDDQDCVLKVQDLTSQLTVLKNRIFKKEKELKRSDDVKQKFKNHNSQVVETYNKMVQIAQHYEIDVNSLFPSSSGQASTVASSLQSSTSKKKSKEYVHDKLEKKLKSLENDYQASRLKNKINDMKRSKKTLISRKQQLQLQFFSQVELTVLSRQKLLALINKFKSTGDNSTIRIVEKWENLNIDLLTPKQYPTKMMSANPTTGIDRKTPHMIKGGNVVIQGKPLRASGSNKGVIGGYAGDARRAPPNQTLISGENMIEEDIMMKTDLSAISKRISNNVGSDYDINQISSPRDSQVQPTRNKVVSSKPFTIKKGQFSKQEKKEKIVSDQDIPDQVIVEDDQNNFNNNNFSKPQKKFEGFEKKDQEQEVAVVKEKSSLSKPSFASKPFGKPFGKGKPNLKSNFNLHKEEQQKNKIISEQPKNVYNFGKKEQQEQIPFSQQFGIKQDHQITQKKSTPPPPSDPFAQFDNYDPLQKYNKKPEVKNDVNNISYSSKKTHDFLNDSSRISKDYMKKGLNQTPYENKNDFGLNNNKKNNNKFSLNKQEQSDFDDLDFENTERKASIQESDVLNFQNKKNDDIRKENQRKSPIDNWPEVARPTKQELNNNNNNNNNQDLDFEDLDF